MIVDLWDWTQLTTAHSPPERWEAEADGLIQRFAAMGAPLDPALAEKLRRFMADASGEKRFEEIMKAQLRSFVELSKQEAARQRHEAFTNDAGSQFKVVIVAELFYAANGATFGRTSIGEAGDEMMHLSVI